MRTVFQADRTNLTETEQVLLWDGSEKWWLTPVVVLLLLSLILVLTQGSVLAPGIYAIFLKGR